MARSPSGTGDGSMEAAAGRIRRHRAGAFVQLPFSDPRAERYGGDVDVERGGIRVAITVRDFYGEGIKPRIGGGGDAVEGSRVIHVEPRRPIENLVGQRLVATAPDFARERLA